MATVEEMYLLAQIARGLGCGNIDHRLRQLDFRAQESEAAFPSLGLAIADAEHLEGVLVVGCDLRREMPMLAHRIRKAVVNRGARVAFLNPLRFDYMFPVAGYIAATDMLGELTALVQAAAQGAGVTDAHRSLLAALTHGSRRAVILGTLAQRHPAYAQLRVLSAQLAALCAASIGCITEGPNAAGAYLAGAVPHREAGGVKCAQPGLTARAMLDSPLKTYVLLGGIDPANDLGVDPWALAAADMVIAITTHLPQNLRNVAHVVLPIGGFAETSGTFVSIEGRWQSWLGAAKLPGDSRPGWKVLRVLANLLNLKGIDYDSSEQIRDALKSCGERLGVPGTVGMAHSAAEMAHSAAEMAHSAAEMAHSAAEMAHSAAEMAGSPVPTGAWVDIPPYQTDVLVRGSDALAKTKDGRMTRTVL